MAKLTAIYGPMFSGKTREVIEMFNRAHGKKLVFKHSVDVRTQATLSSHDPRLNDKIAATPINSLYQVEEYLDPDVKWVFIDEAQFFDTVQVIKFLDGVIARGGDVHYVFSGLDLNFKGDPFESMAVIIRKCDERKWHRSLCAECGDVATHSYYKDHASAQGIVAVGGSDLYEPRCHSCHEAGLKEAASA